MTPRACYHNQKQRAAARGIEWLFTFETWLAVWEASGKLPERGRAAGKYVMARPGDVGPYSPSNVTIIPYEQNARDCRANHPVSSFELCAQSLNKGHRGWSFVRNGYQVTCAKKYIGRFPSQPEAEAAYADACAARLAELRLAGANPTGSEAGGTK